MKGRLFGVSVGPGDPEYMTLKAIRTIERCPVIAAPRTDGKCSVALEIVQGVRSMEDKEILFLDFLMSRDEARTQARNKELAALIAEKLDMGLDVAMLNLGDASLYASYCPIRQHVAGMGYETQTIAGVTSFCASAALLQVSLTSPRLPLRILPGDYSGLETELGAPGTKVIMKSGKELAAVKQALKNSHAYDRAKMVVNCTMPGERAYHSLDGAQGGYFTTIIVGECED